MKRDKWLHVCKLETELSFRRASLLDVPLIFELLQEGAEAGAFTDSFVHRTGSTKLLGIVLRGVISQPFQSSKSKARFKWQVISIADGVEVGFAKVSRGNGLCKNCNLELLAIKPEYRNRGIGSAVLESIQSKVQPGGQLYVHCTKYARAMQHILKRNRLKRNVKFGVPNFEEYRTNWDKLD